MLLNLVLASSIPKSVHMARPDVYYFHLSFKLYYFDNHIRLKYLGLKMILKGWAVNFSSPGGASGWSATSQGLSYPGLV